MSKLFKISGMIIGAIVVLFAAALLWIALFFDPNQFKPQISAAVKQATGRELTIDGDIGLSLFPWLGMELGQITLSNAAAFGDTPFAHIDGAEIKLKLLPLLKQEVEMKTVSLHGLRLNLQIAADGGNNWADLSQPAPAEAPAEAVSEEPGAGGAKLASLAIGGLEISDANLVYDDRSSGARYAIEQLNLETGPLALDAPLDVELSSRFSSSQPQIGGTLGFKAHIVPDLSERQRHRIEKLQVTLDFDSPEFGSRGQVKLSGDIQADLVAEQHQIKNLVIESSLQNDPQLNGKAVITLATQIDADLKQQLIQLPGTRINIDLDSANFGRGQVSLNSDIVANLGAESYQLKNLNLDTTLENADLPGGKAVAKLVAQIEANLKQQTASVSHLKVSAYDLDIDGQINATKIIDAPEFNGELAVAEFSPRKLMQTLGLELPETADANVLNKAALNTKLGGTPENIKLDALHLRLDESNLKGSLEVKLAADKPMPGVRYDLTLDAIDADRYLPPPSEEPAPAAPPASAGGAAAAQLPMELLRGLDIIGSFNLGKLKISGLHASDIKTRLKAQDGVIEVQPTANLYQGSYKGDVQLDARNDVPVIKLNEALSGIQAGPLLKDLIDDDMLRGKGSVTAKLTTQGHTPDEMTAALNGDIAISFANGNLRDFNLAQMLREAKAKLKREPLPDKGEVKGTDFTELTGTFKVINGVVHNDDLATKAPFVRISGAGKVDLVKQQLDYLVNAAVVKSSKGEGGAGLDELAGLTVPVKITGSFSEPKFDLQYDDILKARTKEELERAKAELKAKADAEKARLEAEAKERLAAEKQKLEAEKAAAREKLDAEKAAAQLKLEQEKQRLEQELKQKQQEQLKQKEEELKNKLKGMFER